MMYQVIKEFHDLQDATNTKGSVIYQKYSVGDIYPRKGMSPSEGRIAELAGSDNAQGQPLIQAVEEGAPKQEPAPEESAPASAVEEMPIEEEATEKPKKKPKKKLSKKAAADE